MSSGYREQKLKVFKQTNVQNSRKTRSPDNRLKTGMLNIDQLTLKLANI